MINQCDTGVHRKSQGVKDKDRKWNVNMTHKDNYLQNEIGTN